MDMNLQLLTNHRDHFIASRLESARTVRYGNGSLAASMIASVAAAIRRAAATVERWARGASAEQVDYQLPTVPWAR